jgi:hypothetical protein
VQARASRVPTQPLDGLLNSRVLVFKLVSARYFQSTFITFAVFLFFLKTMFVVFQPNKALVQAIKLRLSDSPASLYAFIHKVSFDQLPKLHAIDFEGCTELPVNIVIYLLKTSTGVTNEFFIILF